MSRLTSRETWYTQAQQRKEDTRRKIFVGSMILDFLDKGTWPADLDQFHTALNAYLERDRDRVLFDRPSRVADTAASDHAPVRIDLNVRIEGKDEVKQLGARWDPRRRKWWIMSDHPRIDQLQPWMPQDTGD